MSEQPLLIVRDLVKHFPLGGGMIAKPHSWVKAVDGVSFEVARGESFGLVGESGCGKTTLGRLILKLIEPTSGTIDFNGLKVTDLDKNQMKDFRRKVQIIFQDPYSSLDPRMRVKSIITEPLRAVGEMSKQEMNNLAGDLLEKVGLRRGDLEKYPHEFSGGQRQRIGIARALCVQPEMIVADEPVSALDVSIQAQVINLMEDLRAEFNLSYVFISHDLSVVEHICNRIAVMYLGSIVELAPTGVFTEDSRHPYTRALLSAVPLPDPKRRVDPMMLDGDVPNPIDPPPGCAFHPRCPFVLDVCREKRPGLVEIGEHHQVACWLNDGRGLEREEK